MRTQTLVPLTLAVFLCAAPAAFAEPFSNLNFLNQLTTGDYQFDADGQTFDARVDHDGTSGWLLVGRGREGWAFTDAQQGSVASVNQNLATTSAFPPAHYSSAIINDLISNSNNLDTSATDLTDIEIRIRRAQDTTGTSYQEYRWRPTSELAWRWNFDTGMAREYEIISGIGGPIGPGTAGDTRDVCCGGGDVDNGPRRIFTWAWGGHNNQQGFSFGSTVGGVNGNDPNTFLWEFNTENHAIPYTEVFIRNINEPNDPLSVVPEPASIAVWLLLGLGLVGCGYRRFRRK